MDTNVIPTQELLIRLERNNTAMHRLLQKLGSYTCEPNNQSCFEKLYNLKQDFKTFSSTHSKLVDILKGSGPASKKLTIEIKDHLNSFKKLESDMAAYLLDTNQYY